MSPPVADVRRGEAGGEVKSFTLLPPADDACKVCGAKHEPDLPHDPQSLYWQTKRALQERPSPTWREAMEHCAEWVQRQWTAALQEMNVDIDKPGGNPDAE